MVVDLIGYRRHGHSEVDDPTVTQPLMYKAIKEHRPLFEIYAKQIGSANLTERVTAVKARIRKRAEGGAASQEETDACVSCLLTGTSISAGGTNAEYEATTGLPREELAELTERLTTYPEGFHIHPKVKKLLEQRAEMGAGKKPLDYGMAEALAFASLLKQGIPVRLTGQDARRATFNQRHSVLIDIENESEYVPLATSRRRPGALRNLQLAALGSGRDGLRVRLQPRLS